MSNRTNKKSPDNRGEIKEKELEMSLRSIWLGRKDSNRCQSKTINKEFSLNQTIQITAKDYKDLQDALDTVIKRKFSVCDIRKLDKKLVIYFILQKQRKVRVLPKDIMRWTM